MKVKKGRYVGGVPYRCIYTYSTGIYKYPSTPSHTLSLSLSVYLSRSLSFSFSVRLRWLHRQCLRSRCRHILREALLTHRRCSSAWLMGLPNSASRCLGFARYHPVALLGVVRQPEPHNTPNSFADLGPALVACGQTGRCVDTALAELACFCDMTALCCFVQPCSGGHQARQ